jgi:hypothetical protein
MSVNLLLAAILIPTAYAGFVDFECKTIHHWNFDPLGAELNLSLKVINYDEVLMLGEADSDPTFHIKETITNHSGLSWTGFKLELLGSGVYFGTKNPTSNYKTVKIEKANVAFWPKKCFF